MSGPVDIRPATPPGVWPAFLVAAALTVLAGGLRFARLGDWPFAGDELASMVEADSLTGRRPQPPDSPFARLPRVLPLGHAVLAGGYEAFGRSEWGSRVASALAGSLGVGVAAWLVARSGGVLLGGVVGLLVVAWPEHLFRSQESRFYAVAWVFASAGLAAGAVAAARRSVGWAAAACGCVVASLLCQTVLAGLLGTLAVGVVAAAVAERRRPAAGPLIAVAVSAVAVAGFAAVYLWPLLRGWNQAAGWGYPPVRAVLGTVNMLGWPLALLVAFGAAVAASGRRPADWYWLAALGSVGVANVCLPRLVEYHPAYVFPMLLPAVVLAGRGVEAVAVALWPNSRLAAVAAVGLAAVSNAPGVVSYYADGSRPDVRTAAGVVRDGWRPGDRVAAVGMRDSVAYYAPECGPVESVSVADPVEQLADLANRPGRLWVVVPGNRGGPPADLAGWLGRECRPVARVRRPRYDYYDYTVDLYVSPGREAR